MSQKPGTQRTTILRVGLAAAALFALTVLVSAALAGGRRPAAPEISSPADSVATAGAASGTILLGHISDRISESSGLARSALHEGVLWTHDDGAAERLHAISFEGEWLASIRVSGTEGGDWEDLSLAPCPGRREGDCLYVADTGDNRADRDTVRILVIPEPRRLDAGEAVVPVVVVTVRYPDGPVDAEALAVDGDGRALIVSKGEDGEIRLYELPAGVFDEPERRVREARLLARLPIDARRPDGRVTGATLSPDGRTLALVGGAGIYLFPVDRWTSIPRICPVGGDQPQAEAIAFLDPESLVLTSEGAGSPILAVRCP